MSLDAARKAARMESGKVAAGRDPAAEKAEGRRRERAGVKAALDAYEKDLVRRRIVKVAEIMSLLRRELLDRIGNIDLAGLDRQVLVGRIVAIEDGGQRGKAHDFRAKLAVFLNWATNHGLIPASPLGGYRNPRRTRAERLEHTGRALADVELEPLWRAIDAQDDPFLRAYLKALLLTGQRRTETSLMRWPDLDLGAGVWSIPADVTKSGRAHRVPVPSELVAVLGALPRMAGTNLVFPGRRLRPMSGWSKRLAPIQAATTKAGLARWTLHDLRRTVRTGLGHLGVDAQIAELLLNHAVSDELQAVYDRGDYWIKRADASARWARHVLAATQDESDNVVSMYR